VTGRSNTGVGVRGIAAGVSTDTGGNGVFGVANNPQGVGVWGACDAAFGVGMFSQSASFVGMWGQTTSGTAVVGDVGAGASGASNTGVQGRVGVIVPNSQSVTVAVSGYNQSTGQGGVGVRGHIPNTTNAGATTGVQGINQSTGVNGVGVYGSSAGGAGVYGFARAAGTTAVVAGVYGDSTTTYGVIGNTTASGYSGLTGITSTPGVAALAATSTVNTAYAAYFTGTTVVQGDFVVVSGAKSAAVPHADGTHRLVYCVESPEAWFEDFGKAKLVGGKGEVKLDADFASIVHADDYHIFLTAYGESNGLHVTNQTAGGFAVQEAKGGASSLTFSWRAVAKRKDIKGERLAKFAPPKIKTPDPAKLPKPANELPAPKLPLPPATGRVQPVT
jgi:hypothetical protein